MIELREIEKRQRSRVKLGILIKLILLFFIIVTPFILANLLNIDIVTSIIISILFAILLTLIYGFKSLNKKK